MRVQSDLVSNILQFYDRTTGDVLAGSSYRKCQNENVITIKPQNTLKVSFLSRLLPETAVKVIEINRRILRRGSTIIFLVRSRATAKRFRFELFADDYLPLT